MTTGERNRVRRLALVNRVEVSRAGSLASEAGTSAAADTRGMPLIALRLPARQGVDGLKRYQTLLRETRALFCCANGQRIWVASWRGRSCREQGPQSARPRAQETARPLFERTNLISTGRKSGPAFME